MSFFISKGCPNKRKEGEKPTLIILLEAALTILSHIIVEAVKKHQVFGMRIATSRGMDV